MCYNKLDLLNRAAFAKSRETFWTGVVSPDIPVATGECFYHILHCEILLLDGKYVWLYYVGGSGNPNVAVNPMNRGFNIPPNVPRNAPFGRFGFGFPPQRFGPGPNVPPNNIPATSNINPAAAGLPNRGGFVPGGAGVRGVPTGNVGPVAPSVRTAPDASQNTGTGDVQSIPANDQSGNTQAVNSESVNPQATNIQNINPQAVNNQNVNPQAAINPALQRGTYPFWQQRFGLYPQQRFFNPYRPFYNFYPGFYDYPRFF